MNPIFRLVVAVIAGIGIASMLMWLVSALNNNLYPAEIMNPTIQEQVTMIAKAPLSEFMLIFAGNMLSSFFGSYTAARLAPGFKKLLAGLFVGFFLLLCGVFYFILIPHPIMFAAITCVLYLPFSYAGARLGKG
jgi:hypothetical protein